MDQTAVKCDHSMYSLFADDEVFNKARQQEQREFRQSGEQFSLRFRYTCLGCGAKVFVERVLRKK